MCRLIPALSTRSRASLIFAVLLGVSCHAADLRTAFAPTEEPPATATSIAAALPSTPSVCLEETLALFPQSIAATPAAASEAAPPEAAPPIRGDEQSGRVRPQRTPWGRAGNHTDLVHNMNTILVRNGVDDEHVRVRMIAHAIIASGWRQSVWHHNAWGVKQGSWKAEWYEMPTIEADDMGNRLVVQNERWRAFSSWEEAIADYQNRITKRSRRPSYRKAAIFLNDPHRLADAAYWEALGNGNYYTAQAFTPTRFSLLCRYVRRELDER
jgi:hypothetical protein